MWASWVVTMSGVLGTPRRGFWRGVRRRGDVVVVIGDGGYSLFSVIADCVADRSTMALSAA